MPTYEYRCSTCQSVKEVDQKISDDPLLVCPDCHNASLTKLFPRSVSVQFKGPGFYATDYQNKSSCDTCTTCPHK